ncbi:MAG: rod shape-determining protein MreC [Litorimonas sp.]
MSNFQRYDGVTARIAFLAAFLTSFILLLSQRGSPNLRGPSQRATEDVVSPIAQILSYPIRGMENMATRFKDRSQTYEQNIQLRDEIAKLRDRQIQLNLLELKVKRYERILSARLDVDVSSKKIVARAVSETNGPFVRSLLLNAGQKNDVNMGNPVMSVDGLIGHVISVGQKSSRALKLGDLNSRIPVLNRRTESKAILSGDNSVRPLLAFIQNPMDWEPGDVVITSGDDGMLPMGLPVGKVIKNNAQELRVKLYAEKAPTDWVWVLPFRPILAPTKVITDEVAEGVKPVTDDAP